VAYVKQILCNGSLQVRFGPDMRIYYWHLTLAHIRMTFDQMAVNTLLEHHRVEPPVAPQSTLEVADAFLKTLDTACTFMTSDWGLPVHTLRALEVSLPPLIQ
jgi:hypothetical protein